MNLSNRYPHKHLNWTILSYAQTANKPRGLQAARKLRTSRRENRWADKNYKKRALGKFYKTSPTGGSSHAKGIVLEKVSFGPLALGDGLAACERKGDV